MEADNAEPRFNSPPVGTILLVEASDEALEFGTVKRVVLRERSKKLNLPLPPFDLEPFLGFFPLRASSFSRPPLPASTTGPGVEPSLEGLFGILEAAELHK